MIPFFFRALREHWKKGTITWAHVILDTGLKNSPYHVIAWRCWRAMRVSNFSKFRSPAPENAWAHWARGLVGYQPSTDVAAKLRRAAASTRVGRRAAASRQRAKQRTALWGWSRPNNVRQTQKTFRTDCLTTVGVLYPFGILAPRTLSPC